MAILLLLLSGAAASTVGAQNASPSGTATVMSSDGVNLRASPTTEAPILETLPFAATVTLTGAATPDGWYPVTAGTVNGWVDGAFIAAGSLDSTAARSATPLFSPPVAAHAATPSPSGPSPSPAASPRPAAAQPGLTETMTASYYGVDDSTVAGTMTACGIPFDPYNTHDASTNDFGCGTKLLVTAPSGKQIEVVVTDHGGYVSHWMDLTYAAFSLIADRRQGVVQVTVQVEP